MFYVVCSSKFPFSVCKNVRLTEENAVNICNNIFFNKAKKEKKVFGNKWTYKVVLYKTSIVLYILDKQQYQLSFVTEFVALEKKDSVIVEVNYVINAKRR